MGLAKWITVAIALLTCSVMWGCGNSPGPVKEMLVSGSDVRELASLDDVMTRFMKKWALPGGSLAVVKDGRLVYARGFGWADEVNAIPVQPTSLFRIASVSKVITSVAVMKLYEEGLLGPAGLDALVFGPGAILDDAIYSNIKDERIKSITVRHLLQHTGGWNSGLGYDPQFDELAIAAAMAVAPPPDSVTIIRYMLASKSLDFAPGTEYHYSNFGYNILGRVIEKLSGMSYEAYARRHLFSFSRITDMSVGGNLASEQLPNEVLYYDPPGITKKSVYGTGETLPYSYGGLNLRAMDAHGGWIASPTDLLRFMTSVDGFGLTPSVLAPATITLMTTKPTSISSSVAMGWDMASDGSWARSGALSAGTFAYLQRRADRIEWAVVFNRLPMDAADPSGSSSRFNDDFFDTFPAALSAITAWPAHDLF